MLTVSPETLLVLVRGHVTGAFHQSKRTGRHTQYLCKGRESSQDDSGAQKVKKQGPHGIGDKCVTLFSPTAGTRPNIKPNILREDEHSLNKRGRILRPEDTEKMNRTIRNEHSF